MPRKPLIRHDSFPYHITSRSNHREWFKLPLEKTWKIALDCLDIAHEKYPNQIIAFVLMANHYHLLVQTPNSDIEFFMYEFNKAFSLRLRHHTRKVNRMFGGRYKWCLIKNNQYFLNCIRYVYQNPLRAGICKNCQDYPFSTLYYIHNRKNFIVDLHQDFATYNHQELQWLNLPINCNEHTALKRALYRTELEKLTNVSQWKKIENYSLRNAS